jgi:transposase-like protein
MAKPSIELEPELVQSLFKDPDVLTRLLEAVAQAAMAAEVAGHLAAGRHERTPDRQGHRNGYKPRALKTRVGDLALSVPQVRGCEPYRPSLFGRWQRSERALLVACAEMYFQGVSTRNVSQVLGAMCDGEISAATVSCVAAELDEKLAAFRARRLNATAYPYLTVDARYEKVRVDGKVVSQAVLVVAGFTSEGRREVLDWRLGDSESQSTWGELFRDLKDRGLAGVRLVVSDAHKGIRAALDRHFQGVAWQRCQVHFKRELAKRVSYKAAGELMAAVRAVFAAGSVAECLARGEELAAARERTTPAVAAALRAGLADCLTVMSMPEGHRPRLASTNMLESLMKRLKKRTRVVGVFPNRASCDRLIGAQLMEVHEAWATEERLQFNMDLKD